MTTYLTAYVATAVAFLAIDTIWLGAVAVRFYKSQLGGLLASPINYTAAAIFYLVYCIGIVIFAISPALQSGFWTDAAFYGALFGFFCYATYDMTNLATIRNWPTTMSLVDICWGTFLTSLSAALGTVVATAVT